MTHYRWERRLPWASIVVVLAAAELGIVITLGVLLTWHTLVR